MLRVSGLKSDYRAEAIYCLSVVCFMDRLPEINLNE